MDSLEKMLDSVDCPDKASGKAALERWNRIAKPLHSLGKLEDIIIQIAEIQETPDIDIGKRALAVFCADNGVVAQGVTQTGQEVTAIVSENFLSGATSSAVMAKKAGVDLFPYDFGIVRDTAVCRDYKVCSGTADMTLGPAMTRDQCLMGIFGGIRIAADLHRKGYRVLAQGEMGIGNTATSSAVSSVLLHQDPEDMTGRGAGLSDQGFKKKISAVKRAIEVNSPDPDDPVDVLAKVGGLDLAGITGLTIGGGLFHMPVVMDGFISLTASLAAVRLCPRLSGYLIASHVSREPAAKMLLQELEKEAVIHGGLFLGEGTGAVSLFPLLDLAVGVYKDMSTFEDISVDQYEDYR